MISNPLALLASFPSSRVQETRPLPLPPLPSLLLRAPHLPRPLPRRRLCPAAPCLPRPSLPSDPSTLLHSSFKSPFWKLTEWKAKGLPWVRPYPPSLPNFSKTLSLRKPQFSHFPLLFTPLWTEHFPEASLIKQLPDSWVPAFPDFSTSCHLFAVSSVERSEAAWLCPSLCAFSSPHLLGLLPQLCPPAIHLHRTVDKAQIYWSSRKFHAYWQPGGTCPSTSKMFPLMCSHLGLSLPENSASFPFLWETGNTCDSSLPGTPHSQLITEF